MKRVPGGRWRRILEDSTRPCSGRRFNSGKLFLSVQKRAKSVANPEQSIVRALAPKAAAG